MTDKEKIRKYLVGMATAACCDENTRRIINELILPYIDSMPEEPVSKELEEAARECTVRIKGFPGIIDDTDKKVIKAFKAGADWQKKCLPKWKKTEDPDGLYWSIDEATIVFKGYALDLTELEDVLEKED